MKKMLMKFSFHKLAVAFLMFMGVAFANSASAQAVNWKTEQQAESILLSQVAYHAQVLDNPANPGYNAALQRVVYFKGILRLIYNGNSVAVSTEKALVEASGALNQQDGNTATAAPKTEMQALYNEAFSLLTN